MQDLERTRAFYHGKLQLPLIGHIPGSHVFFRAGTSVLLCFLPEVSRHKTHLPGHYGEGNLHFAFEVKPEDYQASKKFIEENGIPIEHEASWGELKSFYFRDPDGHSVEIVMHDIWA